MPLQPYFCRYCCDFLLTAVFFMLDILRRNRLFFLTCGLLWLGTAALLLLFSKEQLIHWVNDHNAPWADDLFRYATYLGDGVFFILVVVVLLIRSRAVGLAGLGAFLLSSGVSILLKQVVFLNALRPSKYFEHAGWAYHTVKDVVLAGYHSFPSGHTISAFAMFGFLALVDDRKGRGWTWALLGALVGYSRVYLFQHFVADAFAGSLIGTASAVVAYAGLLRWHRQAVV
jgi:membrane-associated phospholipid phosphatase